VNQIHRSGYVRRYHSNPDLAAHGDSLAHHQGQVAQIILEFHPAPSIDLIYEALHHDCGESDVGDMSATAKAENPELAAMLAASETLRRARMGCPERKLTDTDARWLKWADRLQARRHVSHVAPHVLTGDGWPEQAAWLHATAWALGIGAEFAGERLAA